MEILKQLWTEWPPESGKPTAALANEIALYRLAKQRDPKITRKMVRQFLKNSSIRVKDKEPAKIRPGYSPIVSGQPGKENYFF